MAATGRKLAEILALANVQVNGSRPWDVQVHDERFYPRMLSEGSLGAGESYVDGWWEVEALDKFFTISAPIFRKRSGAGPRFGLR